MHQITGVVEDTGIVTQVRKGFRDTRRAAGAEHDGARQTKMLMALGIGGYHLEPIDALGAGYRLDPRHRLAIGALIGELAPYPAQIVVVLQAARIKSTQVDEINQPALLVQVVDETVGAGGIAQGHQIFEEGDLQFALRHQRIAMPAIILLLVEEQHVAIAVLALALLLQGNGQRQVGGAEADAQHVVRWSNQLSHGACVL